MAFKFEKLEVWELSLEYLDLIYRIAEQLPRSEEFNLKSQIVRAATSVALNIAEGSTGQSDAEQSRFLGMAIRSLIETIACLHITKRRNYVDVALLRDAYQLGERLCVKLQAFRRSLGGTSSHRVREEEGDYVIDSELPF